MAIVRLDKVLAGSDGNLESVKFVADQTNGVFFILNGLAAGEREVFNAIAPAAVTTDEVLLHASPEVMYNPLFSRLEDYVLSAGQVGRGFHLHIGDIISLTSDLITGAPAVGAFAVPANGAFKLAAAADLVGNTRLAFKIIDTDNLGFMGAANGAAYVLQVVKR